MIITYNNENTSTSLLKDAWVAIFRSQEAKLCFEAWLSVFLFLATYFDARSGGVVLYALLCGSLPFDDENVPWHKMNSVDLEK